MRWIGLGGMAAMALALASGAHPAVALDLSLTCPGTGTHIETEQTVGSASNSFGGQASGSAETYRQASVRERLRVRLRGVEAEVKVPRVLIPAVNRSGTDGWFKVTDVVVSDAKIEGRFALNVFNKPRLVIDRHTGDIDVKGSFGFSFSGTCEKAEDEPTATKF